MEILFALLMAIAATAYPLFVDIRRHGKDNILRRTVQDILSWTPIASISTLILNLGHSLQRAIATGVSVLLLLWLIWVFLKFFGVL